MKSNSESNTGKSFSKTQLKLLLVFLGAVIVISSVIFTNLLVEELISREQKSVNLYIDIYKRWSAEIENTDLIDFLIDKISPMITFPMIITDDKGEPYEPYESYTLNLTIDSTLKPEQKKAYIKKQLLLMEKNYKPIIVENSELGIKTKFYYSHSSLIDKLRLFPFIEIIIIAVFIFTGYLAFSSVRKNEESKVWVGMAKEAAHQLGTPLSSLLAWIEIIKSNVEDSKSVKETVDEMENDINRLNMIANRFSKIGSRPELNKENISNSIEKVCSYFEKRLPHLNRKVEIIRNCSQEIYVSINQDLFVWVIENLLKNAAEAIETKKGKVTINVKTIKNKTVIEISDNGKGMSMKQRRQVFYPGFTTKKRGWGLGLSLSKRIVEDYHNGKIYVKESIPNKGTIFVIELPVIS